MSRAIRLFMLVTVLATFLLVGTAPAQAGGGCHASELTDATTAEISARGNCFSPSVARVDVGQKVTWRSDDPLEHTVTAVAGAFGSMEGPPLTQGAPVEVTFDRPGIYPYVCVLHPTMAGAIVVGDGGLSSEEAGEVSATAVSATPAASTNVGLAGAAGSAAVILLILGATLLYRRRGLTTNA